MKRVSFIDQDQNHRIGQEKHENQNLRNNTQRLQNDLTNCNLLSSDELCQEKQSIRKKEKKNKTEDIIQENIITTINKSQIEDLNAISKPQTYSAKSPICMDQLSNEETKKQQISLHSFLSEDTLKKPSEYSHRQLETAVVTPTSTTTQSCKHEYEQKSKSVPNQHFDFYSAQFESKTMENQPVKQNNDMFLQTKRHEGILPVKITPQISQNLGLGSFQKWLKLKNENQEQQQLQQQQQQYNHLQYLPIQYNSNSPEQSHCFSARQSQDQQKQNIVIPKIFSIKKQSDLYVPQEGSYSTESFTPPQKRKQFYQQSSDAQKEINKLSEKQQNIKKTIVPGQMLFHSEESFNFSNPITRREYLENSNQLGMYNPENDQYTDRTENKQHQSSSSHQSHYLNHNSRFQEIHLSNDSFYENHRENDRRASKKLTEQRQLVDPVDLMRSLAYYCPVKYLPDKQNNQTERSSNLQDFHFGKSNNSNSLDSARQLRDRSCSKAIEYYKKNIMIVEEKVEERLIRKGKLRDNKISQLRVQRDLQFHGKQTIDSLRSHPSSSSSLQRNDKDNSDKNAASYGIMDRKSTQQNNFVLNLSNLNNIRNSTPSNLDTSRVRGGESMQNPQSLEYFQGSNVQRKMSQKICCSRGLDQRTHTAGTTTTPPLRQSRDCPLFVSEKLAQHRENSLKYQFHPDILTSPRNNSTNRDKSRSSADFREHYAVELVASPEQAQSWRDLQKRKRKSADKLRQIKKALLVGADNIRKAAENLCQMSQRFESLYEQNQQVNNRIVESPRECRQFDQSQVFSLQREMNMDDRRDTSELNHQYSEEQYQQQQPYLVGDTFYQQQQQQNQYFYSFNQQF